MFDPLKLCRCGRVLGCGNERCARPSAHVQIEKGQIIFSSCSLFSSLPRSHESVLPQRKGSCVHVSGHDCDVRWPSVLSISLSITSRTCVVLIVLRNTRSTKNGFLCDRMKHQPTIVVDTTCPCGARFFLECELHGKEMYMTREDVRGWELTRDCLKLFGDVFYLQTG